MQSIILFILAGFAEIAGGYLVWCWIREGKPAYFGIIGSLLVILYAFIPTIQKIPTFGRVYAAYGGIFVVLSVAWGWIIDKNKPDAYDLIGAFICIVGVSVMLWAPRKF